MSSLSRVLQGMAGLAFVAGIWAGCGGSSGSTSPSNDAGMSNDVGTTNDVGVSSDGNACPATQLSCGGVCTEVMIDPQNCGSCGKACGALQVCTSGACASECAQGQTMCGGDGGAAFCASTSSDNANCGSCGHACAANQVCAGGTCSTSCPSTGQGELLCTPDGGASYCAATLTDNANCGGCGKTCGPAQVCSMGACVPGCGGMPIASMSADGGAGEAGVAEGGEAGSPLVSTEMYCAPEGGAPYCASILTDNANCGACGNVCALGQTCTGGSCGCQSVLLLSTGSPAAGLIAGLQAAQPAFCVVDYINVNAAMPSLATLSRYSAVLVYNELFAPYSNGAAVGNLVADYFDEGGHVVSALFADAGYPIAGRFVSAKYILITPVNAPQAADSFSSADPTEDLSPASSVLTGVSSIVSNGSSPWRGTQTAENGGVAIAKYKSGNLLAVTGVVVDAHSRSRNRVDLNIHPSDIASGAWTGDGFKLLANALLYQ